MSIPICIKHIHIKYILDRGMKAKFQASILPSLSAWKWLHGAAWYPIHLIWVNEFTDERQIYQWTWHTSIFYVLL